MSEYIIVGDTEKYKDCLVCPCGVSLDRAKGILDRMINIAIKDYKRKLKKTYSFDSNILQGFSGLKGTKGLKGLKGSKF